MKSTNCHSNKIPAGEIQTIFILLAVFTLQFSYVYMSKLKKNCINCGQSLKVTQNKFCSNTCKTLDHKIFSYFGERKAKKEAVVRLQAIRLYLTDPKAAALMGKVIAEHKTTNKFFKNVVKYSEQYEVIEGQIKLKNPTINFEEIESLVISGKSYQKALQYLGLSVSEVNKNWVTYRAIAADKSGKMFEYPSGFYKYVSTANYQKNNGLYNKYIATGPLRDSLIQAKKNKPYLDSPELKALMLCFTGTKDQFIKAIERFELNKNFINYLRPFKG